MWHSTATGCPSREVACRLGSSIIKIASAFSKKGGHSTALQMTNHAKKPVTRISVPKSGLCTGQPEVQLRAQSGSAPGQCRGSATVWRPSVRYRALFRWPGNFHRGSCSAAPGQLKLPLGFVIFFRRLYTRPPGPGKGAGFMRPLNIKDRGIVRVRRRPRRRGTGTFVIADK